MKMATEENHTIAAIQDLTSPHDGKSVSLDFFTYQIVGIIFSPFVMTKPVIL